MYYCRKVRASLHDEERKKDVSASIGIAIANHLTPLSFVRQAAIQAEKLAKNRYGRSALVITVIRSSGAQTCVGCHWHYDNLDKDAQPIPLFSRFYQLFKQDILSPKCVHILLEEASTLVWLEDREAQSSEIKRILKRHLGQLNNEQASSTEQQLTDKQREVLEKEMEQLAKRLSELARAMDITHPHPETAELYEDKSRYGLVEILGWLLVMAFLAQERHDL
jgi:CRISPR-associated protein Cmr2